MKAKTLFVTLLLIGLFVLSSCAAPGDIGPTNTPDPLLMNINERTIWDFENYKEEINLLAVKAEDLPAEDIEMIVRQMTEITEEIKDYEFPLSAAQIHSALYNFARNTEQCYFGKYMESTMVVENVEFFERQDVFCDQAKLIEETFDQYLLEMKEMETE